MRDEFTKTTKETLAKRVANKCSNPDCQKITIGPNSNPEKSTSLGIACHISAASENGPRYNAKITTEQRKNIANGIWLCSNCSAMIDKDENKYNDVLLNSWKKFSELNAEDELNSNKALKHLKNKSLKSQLGELLNFQKRLTSKLKNGYKRHKGSQIIEEKTFYGKDSFQQLKILIEAILRRKFEIDLKNSDIIEKEICDFFEFRIEYKNYFNFNKQLYKLLLDNKFDPEYDFCYELVKCDSTKYEYEVLNYYLLGVNDNEYVNMLKDLKFMDSIKHENLLYKRRLY